MKKLKGKSIENKHGEKLYNLVIIKSFYCIESRGQLQILEKLDGIHAIFLYLLIVSIHSTHSSIKTGQIKGKVKDFGIVIIFNV